MILPALNGMLTIMLAKFMMNDVPHAMGVYDNPSGSGGSGISEIVSRTGMKWYEPTYFPPTTGEGKPRQSQYRQARQIGQYEIVMTRTGDNCTIKVYEFLEGWKKKLRATWTGIGRESCKNKFEQIALVIRQVRFEEKTRMRV